MNKAYMRFMEKMGDWSNIINRNLVEILNKDIIPEVINIIMEDYAFSLNGVSDIKSKTAPEWYEDEFRDRLQKFKFVAITADGVKITNPDMKNFDFNDGLETVENILEGIVGRYVEISREDYIKVTKMQTYRGEYKDVYLIKYSPLVKKWEGILDKKLDIYPFSNTPPIDIFSRAEDFVEQGLDYWISVAIDKSEKELK